MLLRTRYLKDGVSTRRALASTTFRPFLQFLSKYRPYNAFADLLGLNECDTNTLLESVEFGGSEPDHVASPTSSSTHGDRYSSIHKCSIDPEPTKSAYGLLVASRELMETGASLLNGSLRLGPLDTVRLAPLPYFDGTVEASPFSSVSESAASLHLDDDC